MANPNDVKRALEGAKLGDADLTGTHLKNAGGIPLSISDQFSHKGETVEERTRKEVKRASKVGLPQHATTEDIAIFIADRSEVDENWADLDDRIDDALRSLKLQINTLDIKMVTQRFDYIEIIGSPGPRKRKIVITYDWKGKTLSVERVGGKRKPKNPVKRGSDASKMLNQLQRETLQELELRVASREREAGVIDRVKRMFSSWETLARSGEKDLEGANLSGANLSGADLEGANLTGADLSRANLQRADLIKAKLRGADLTGAYLEGTDLEGANLIEADLREAKFIGADLRGVYLRRADLRGADLTKADLRDAKLTGADLEGANLKGARNLTLEQLLLTKNYHLANSLPPDLTHLLSR
jgi:uncharacterized protein YjbI with pentapeptide repeats